MSFFFKSSKKKINKKTYQLLHYPKKNEIYGEYIGTSPKQVAEKMLYQLYKKYNKNKKFEDNSSYLIFKFQEKELKKEYCYMGKIILLEEPNIVYRNGKKIEYKHKISVYPFNPNFFIHKI